MRNEIEGEVNLDKAVTVNPITGEEIRSYSMMERSQVSGVVGKGNGFGMGKGL